MNYLNKVTKCIKNLCQPAFIYMIYGIINILLLIYVLFFSQDINSSFRNMFNQLGIKISNMFFYYVILTKLIQTIFWIFIIDLLCRNKYNKLAWLIILGTFLGDVKIVV